eukprot:7826041-Lingulodinium_polyedra.AAC.1
MLVVRCGLARKLLHALTVALMTSAIASVVTPPPSSPGVAACHPFAGPTLAGRAPYLADRGALPRC